MNNSNITYLQTTNYQSVLFQRILVLCFLFCTPFLANAQVQDSTALSIADSTYSLDSLGTDSLGFSVSNHKSSLEEQVDYDADDSIILNLQEKKAY